MYVLLTPGFWLLGTLRVARERIRRRASRREFSGLCNKEQGRGIAGVQGPLGTQDPKPLTLPAMVSFCTWLFHLVSFGKTTALPFTASLERKCSRMYAPGRLWLGFGYTPDQDQLSVHRRWWKWLSILWWERRREKFSCRRRECVPDNGQGGCWAVKAIHI